MSSSRVSRCRRNHARGGILSRRAHKEINVAVGRQLTQGQQLTFAFGAIVTVSENVVMQLPGVGSRVQTEI